VRRRVSILWIVAVTAGLAVLAAAWRLSLPGDVERADLPMVHGVYVWQSNWSSATADAVRGAAERYGTDRVYVLAGELKLRPGGAVERLAWAGVDWAAVKAAGPAALVLRIDAYRGPFRADDHAGRAVVRFARRAVAEARGHGVAPAELQLDFDAASRTLDGYRRWVAAVRAAVDVPVTLTVLPAWLDDNPEGFAALVRQADGYVLQVHALDRPERIDDAVALIDPAKAMAWVEAAGRIGEPFRVAVPTYSYALGFDAGGRYLGVAAEDGVGALPAGTTRVKRLSPDPAAMAALVAGWERVGGRPVHMQGLVWFRLPVASDTMNWPPATLAAVIEGRAPRERVVVRLERPEPLLVEVWLANEGEADAAPPGVVRLTWDGRPVASDGLHGFRVRSTAEGGALTPGETGALRPGSRHRVAWLRFTSVGAAASVAAVAAVAGRR